MTSGAVYHYFDSKLALYRETGNMAVAELVAFFNETGRVNRQSRSEQVLAFFNAISENAGDHEEHHWIGPRTALDAAHYPELAETFAEWTTNFHELLKVASAPVPDGSTSEAVAPDDDWDQTPLAVFMNVWAAGASCVVVRNGPAALENATKGMRRLWGVGTPGPFSSSASGA